MLSICFCIPKLFYKYLYLMLPILIKVDQCSVKQDSREGGKGPGHAGHWQGRIAGYLET